MLLFLLIVSGLLELLLYSLNPVWSYRRGLASFLVLLVSFVSGSMAYIYASGLGLAILLVGLYRIFNLLRVIEGRMHEVYLKKATFRSGLIFLILHTGIIAAAYQVKLTNISNLWVVLAVLQLIVALVIVCTTWRNLRKTKPMPNNQYYTDKELPTVTVAIPARNETPDLEQCLQSVVANDYPKLEVIVLDDCSQDKTAEIIRSFAQKGVRFIRGDDTPARWLAKNYAYQRLLDEAEGELILFCGVDVRLEPTSIRAIVTELISRKKSMISFLPMRLIADAGSAFLQPARYWWELAIPRRLFNRPPVLSTCWMINRQTIQKLGGFKAIQHAIIPEGYFARELIKEDGYSFLRSSSSLQVQTVKSITEQRATTIRTLYPQIRRRPENALILTIINLGLFVAPFVMGIVGFVAELGSAHLLAFCAALLLTINHVMIVRATNPPDVLVAVFNLPFAMVMELVLGYVSMFKYEFSTVEWKGRNVCIPVMHTIPHLPKLESRG